MAHIRVASVLLSLSLAALQRKESFLVGLLPGGSTTKSSLPIDIWPFADVAASHIIPDVMPFKANKKQRIWILKENRKLLLIPSQLLSRPTKLYIIILTENEKAVRSQGKSFNFMLGGKHHSLVGLVFVFALS